MFRVLLFLLGCLHLLCLCRRIEGVVISADSMNTFFPTPVVNARHSIQPDIIRLRIRSTRESDLVQVSDILAQELVESSDFGDNHRYNFQTKLEFLKTKASVENLLHSRIKAIDIGQKTLNKYPEKESMTEAEQLRLLWSSDLFRRKLEKAAMISTEPHLWTKFNFACAPETSCWLQHKMITVEDKVTGNIAGFCEIAMLSQPIGKGNSISTEEAAPTVVNLVVSQPYRRQGIASRLLKASSRFVRHAWGSDHLTLYVGRENSAAIRMYETLGFGFRADVESQSRSSQWYMAKNLMPTLSSSTRLHESMLSASL